MSWLEGNQFDPTDGQLDEPDDEDAIDATQTREVTCEMCGGRGRSAGDDDYGCRACNGTGTLTEYSHPDGTTSTPWRGV